LVSSRRRVFYTHPTTFHTLSDAHISWAVYAGDIPQAAAYVELHDLFKERFNTFGEFEEDVHDGTLPSYSFLEPRHFVRVDSQHPTHSVLLGDQMRRRVYTTLASSPDVWRSTLLIVTWDEHGGFYDREAPPETVPPIPGKTATDGFGFDTLGVRVPAVVVSPLIEQGSLSPELHDHASIVRTVFDALGVETHLTERDRQAQSVLPLLTLTEPRDAPPLPRPPSAIKRAVTRQAAPQPVELDDLQVSLLELSRLLDEHEQAPPRRRRVAARGAVVEQVAAPGELEAEVRHFQERHMGNRARRLEREERV
jgi:phospholipase C